MHRIEAVPHSTPFSSIRSIYHPSKQARCTMKGKKKPLGLPSTLQAELGLGLGGGGGGGGMMGSRPGGHGMHSKKRKGAAPLSRKEVR